MLFEIEGEIGSLTVLQHGAEGVRINFYCSKELDYVLMIQFYMNIILAHCMLDVL